MRRILALAFFLSLGHVVIVEAKKGDEWNTPTNNSNNTPKSDKKKSKKKSKDPRFQTSLTFIQPQDLADPKLMKLINSPWNDKAKKEQLHNRLQEFARDFMVDHNKIETLVSRTRKEWEDYDVNQTMATLQGMAKLAVTIVSSPGVQKLLDNREAQEKIRLFLIGLSIQIRSLLDDPRRQMILMNPDRWHDLFEKAKAWQHVPYEQVLESLLNYFDKKMDDNDPN